MDEVDLVVSWEAGARGKLIELEALRGVAALIVLVHHTLLAFFPRVHGLLDPDSTIALFGTPFFLFINGSASVILFFVLSGFVLTLRAFESGSVVPLVTGALKRWPRLLVPVLAVNLASGLLAGFGLYGNVRVAPLVGSSWLSWFFVAPPPEFHSAVAAAREGAVGTFLFGSAYYNSNLWTMTYEFYGSFICFAMAMAMLAAGRFSAHLFAGMLVLILLVGSPYFWCFAVGLASPPSIVPPGAKPSSPGPRSRGRCSGRRLAVSRPCSSATTKPMDRRPILWASTASSGRCTMPDRFRRGSRSTPSPLF